MTRHKTKASLLEDIRAQHGRLEKNLATLTAEEMTRPGVIGEWSVKDILAHLTAWEQFFLGWYAAGQRGQNPDTPAPGYSWRKIDLLNEQIYEAHKADDLEQVQKKFVASYQEIYALLEAVPEGELMTPDCYAWLNGDSLADWAAANTCNHYYWAKTQIRNWMKADS